MSAPNLISPTTLSGGTPVGGSGTSSPSTIPRWTGPSTLGDSVITQSGTNVGVGVPSPSYPFQVQTQAANTNTISLINGTGNVSRLGWVQNGSTTLAYTAIDGDGRAVGYMSFVTAALERARIDSAGNFCIGTAAAATASSRLTVAGGFIAPAAGYGVYQPGDHLTLSGGAGKNVHLKPNDGGVLAVNVGATSCDMSAVSGYGLKLPATPGNADTQTLDCYQEGTWVPTLTGFGGTNPTLTARYTRIGRIVVVQVVIVATGGNQFSSTAATTYISLPAGMTPVFDSPGSTSSSAIAADGACVAYSNGNLYLPTFALRTATTMLNVTYTV